MKKILLVILITPFISFGQTKSKEERQAELEARKKGEKKESFTLDPKFTGSDCGFPVPIPCNENLVEYQSIINSEQKSKTELFDSANQWFAYVFKSGKSVVEYSNQENGKIIGKGSFELNFFNRGNQSIGFTITIEVKDKKLRYTINNLVYYQTSSPSFKNLALEKGSWKIENYPSSWGFKSRFYKQVDDGVKNIISNLENFILKFDTEDQKW